MNTAKNIVHSFSHLFFPHTCFGCGNDLVAEKQFLCLQCISHLPITGFELHAGNAVEKNFWGMVPVNNAMSLFYFTKNSILQNLLHQFKYRGKKEIGFYFGRIMGPSCNPTAFEILMRLFLCCCSFQKKKEEATINHLYCARALPK